jgi:hypothetical protein
MLNVPNCPEMEMLDRRDREETDRLSKAAPYLLEACRDALRRFESIGTVQEGSPAHAAIMLLRDAITKATGQ